ncbi:MAG: protein kinase, partial [Planctomycetota bacterium]
MNTERKERAEELFHKALELNETESAGYLAGACRHDPKLKGEVESLLAALESPSGLLQGIIESILDKPDKNETVDHSQYERSPDLPCRRLGDFKLIRKIGEGGMGIVYLAIQETLNREVAVKIIRPGHEQFLEAAARFWREIESLSKISHPNIAKVFHCGHENQIRYFAMELVEGKGLNEILIESRSYQNKMDLRLLLNWILEIAQALSSAHEAGIIHR